MPADSVLNLDDPDVGIEAYFLGEAFFYGLFRQRFFGGWREDPFDRAALVICGLRRRRIKNRIAVKQRQLDEYSASLLGAAPSYCTKNALGLATTQISRDPDC